MHITLPGRCLSKKYLILFQNISRDEFEGNSRTGKPETPKVNGEMGLDDLPPIEDLAISLPAQDTTKIGTIASIVDRLGKFFTS